MTPRLELELAWRRHGWRMAAGLVLLAIAGGLIARQGISATREETPLIRATDGSRQLESHHRIFRGILIPRQELEVRQRNVIEAITQYGLASGRIDYGQESNVNGRFDVATLQLPLHGNYIDVRSFLAAVLAAQPALAIEDLAIQRDASGGGVDARLRLGFYTEPGLEAHR
jgi:hypothetical protein